MNKVRLGDVAEIKNGSTPSTNENDNYDGDIIWITPKDLSDQNTRFIFRGERTITKKGYNSCSTTLLPAGSILLSSRAPIGLLAIAGVEYCTNQGFKNLILNKEKVDNKFLYYYLKSRIVEIEKLGGGTTFKELSKTSLENFEISLPTLPTQTAIARVLSSLDDKIELNNKINLELENLAKTIYEYWFVQNADENWEKKKIGEIGVEVVRGVTYNKGDIKTANDENVIGILRATNINGNIIDLDNLVYVDKSFVSENQEMQPFDILITMSSGSKDHIGKNGLFPFEKTTVAFGAFCSKIKVNQDQKFYLYEYFQSGQFKTYVKNCCLGTNINNLNNDIIKSILLRIPPTEVLKKFNNTVLPIFEQIIKNNQQSLNLAQLRDFLLPLLMNGQVNVSKTQNEQKIIPFYKSVDNNTKYQTWKTQIGLAARGNIDEQTLRNIYEAIDENDR